DRGAAVPEPAHRGVPPLQGVPEGRRRLADRARPARPQRWKILTMLGVSASACGAIAWYAQACTQALPVRRVSTVLIIPGPRYWKNRKITDSTVALTVSTASHPSK